MPLARIRTVDPDSAADLVVELREAGFEFEFARPDQPCSSHADVEIRTERLETQAAFDRAYEMNTAGMPIFVAPGLLEAPEPDPTKHSETAEAQSLHSPANGTAAQTTRPAKSNFELPEPIPYSQSMDLSFQSVPSRFDNEKTEKRSFFSEGLGSVRDVISGTVLRFRERQMERAARRSEESAARAEQAAALRQKQLDELAAQRETERRRREELQAEMERERAEREQREIELKRQHERAAALQRERDAIEQKQREVEEARQRELQLQREQERARELEQQQRERELAQQRERELAQQRERELAIQREREAAQQRERELAQQRERELVLQRERQLAKEREIAQQRERELALQRERESEARRIEQEKQAQRERDLVAKSEQQIPAQTSVEVISAEDLRSGDALAQSSVGEAQTPESTHAMDAARSETSTVVPFPVESSRPENEEYPEVHRVRNEKKSKHFAGLPPLSRLFSGAKTFPMSRRQAFRYAAVAAVIFTVLAMVLLGAIVGRRPADPLNLGRRGAPEVQQNVPFGAAIAAPRPAQTAAAPAKTNVAPATKPSQAQSATARTARKATPKRTRRQASARHRSRTTTAKKTTTANRSGVRQYSDLR